MLKKGVIFVVALVVCMLGCGPEISTNVQTGGPTVQQALTYQGPRARIAVASFKCKAANCEGIGDGLADMLATALFRTGRFIVLERGEGLEEIKKELNLGQSGYVQQNKAPQIGLMEGADILVIGAITAFEPNASGIGGGGVVVPFKVPLLGGIGAKKKEAYIAADIRLVDVRTGRVINATKVEGKASSWKIGGGAGTVIGTVALGGGLGAYKNTPMEKAIRVMLENAVQAISQMVPESYYRYSANGQPVSHTQMAANTTTTSSGGIVGGQTVAGGQPATGGIVGGGERFVPGQKVLFAEDFSEYQIGQIPNKMRILKGQVEVASFSGKKWLRALSDKVLLTKKVNLPLNFALEWEIYFSKPAWGLEHAVFLGAPRDAHTPDVLWWTSDWVYPRWAGEELKKIKIHAGTIHHFAIQQKNGMLKVFLDGYRIYQAPVASGIVGGKLPNRDAISFDLGGANPSEGREILITNIKVTVY